MGISTGISWAHSTWNPWVGCDKVSDGCKNCYAEREMKRYGRKFNGNVIRTSPATFNAPLKWARTGKLPAGSRIFVCSWSDFFHKDADEWRAEAWEIIRQLPQYNFLIPTKRVERIWDCLPDYWQGNGTSYKDLPNVWLGASVEDQKTADKRIPELLSIPSEIKWLSIEPMLGPIDIFGLVRPPFYKCVDWVVFGGESGPNFRPMNIEWLRDGANQCKSASVPCFVKQLGGWPNTRHELSDFPEDLRIREFPK